MKVYKIFFSPTGGTEKVADILANALGNDVTAIDLAEKEFSGCELDSDSISVIAMPSFGGRAPKTAIDRLKMIQSSGSKAVVVAVYGNRAQEDTLLEMSGIAKQCEFSVIAGIAAIAEHSIAHQFATGRPNSNDAAQLKGFAAKIAEKLNSGKTSEPQLPGNRPYKKAGAGILPSTNSECNSCGLCAEKCPVGAIDRSGPKRIDKNICINCMRCVSICPKKAKNINGIMAKAVGIALKKACSEPKQNELFI